MKLNLLAYAYKVSHVAASVVVELRLTLCSGASSLTQRAVCASPMEPWCST